MTRPVQLISTGDTIRPNHPDIRAVLGWHSETSLPPVLEAPLLKVAKDTLQNPIDLLYSVTICFVLVGQYVLYVQVST